MPSSANDANGKAPTRDSTAGGVVRLFGFRSSCIPAATARNIAGKK
jgi:hypothetical protein